MGRHLMFYLGLGSTRWQSTWMERYVLVYGGVHYVIIWVEITYRNFKLQAWRVFRYVGVACFVGGAGGSVCCSNARADVRSRKPMSFTYDGLGGVFLLI